MARRMEKEYLPALQLLSARQATASLGKPTWLVLENLLTANTRLLHQERALGTRDVLRVTLMLDARMPTPSRFPTLEAALGRPHATRLRWLKDGTATRTADLIENGFWAGATGAPVTQLLASVFAALELTTANLKADVLGFKVVVGASLLPPSLGGLLLTRTAMLAAFVAATVELGLAGAKAHGGFGHSLVTDPSCSRPATSARDVDVLEAWSAVACVALVEAQMPTGKRLVAGLVAMRNIILARLPWPCCDLRQRRLATWAVGHHIRRKGTVGRLLVLRVTGFLAGVMATVKLSATDAAANKRTLEPRVRICPFVSFGRDSGLPVVERFQDFIPLIAGHLSRLLAAVAR